MISIHAPAKGATQPQRPFIQPIRPISIHAPAKGATANGLMRKEDKTFQSTLPRRERPAVLCDHLFQIIHFNPRSREGSDIISEDR